MTIEIKTAVDGCANYCPEFEVVAIKLIENNTVIKRVYRCAHLDECNAMLEAMQTVTINLENIT